MEKTPKVQREPSGRTYIYLFTRFPIERNTVYYKIIEDKILISNVEIPESDLKKMKVVDHANQKKLYLDELANFNKVTVKYNDGIAIENFIQYANS